MRETLYQDDFEPVEMVLDEDGKRYQVDGKEITSVTGIIEIKAKHGLRDYNMKMGLRYAKKRLDNYVGKELTPKLLEEVFEKAPLAADKARDKAAETGSRVHEWIETYRPGKAIPGIKGWKKVDWACLSYIKYVKDTKMKVLFSERPVFSKEWGVSGRIDEYGELNGKRYLTDFKTSANFYPEMVMQELFYADFLNEELDMHTDFLRTVKLSTSSVDYEVLDVPLANFAGVRTANRGALLLTEGLEYIESEILKKYNEQLPVGYEVDMGGTVMRIEDI